MTKPPDTWRQFGLDGKARGFITKIAPAGGAGGRLIRTREGINAWRGSAADERDRPIWLRSSAARAGARAAERLRCRTPARRNGVTARRPIRRSRARSLRSSVGSSHSGDEKASCTSERVRPISASIWRSRRANTLASRRWRIARSTALRTLTTGDSTSAKHADQGTGSNGNDGVLRRHFHLHSSFRASCGVHRLWPGSKATRFPHPDTLATAPDMPRGY